LDFLNFKIAGTLTGKIEKLQICINLWRASNNDRFSILFYLDSQKLTSPRHIYGTWLLSILPENLMDIIGFSKSL
jgi:hypothetical protein